MENICTFQYAVLALDMGPLGARTSTGTVTTNFQSYSYTARYWHLFITWDPFYNRVLISMLAWISNHTPSKVWDENAYLFPNFNGATVVYWVWICNVIHSIICNGCNYLSMLGLKLCRVSKRGPITN